MNRVWEHPAQAAFVFALVIAMLFVIFALSTVFFVSWAIQALKKPFHQASEAVATFLDAAD